MVSVSLSYSGSLAENNAINMYDAARALAGFQRSLALTTHLVLHGEIITQAPALREADIIITTPEPGSWKVTAVVLAGVWAVATAPKDSVPGHLLFSLYDFVVKETLGFHPSYDQSLGVQYEEHLAKKKITSTKVDSLIEKTESSLSDMHRPIVASQSATKADILGTSDSGTKKVLGVQLTPVTYQYVATTIREENEVNLVGSVSSFNINTFKGRIFSYDEGRPIPFELSEDARSNEIILQITTSLRASSINRGRRAGTVRLLAQRLTSSTGRLKALIVFSVNTEIDRDSTAYDDLLG